MDVFIRAQTVVVGLPSGRRVTAGLSVDASLWALVDHQLQLLAISQKMSAQNWLHLVKSFVHPNERLAASADNASSLVGKAVPLIRQPPTHDGKKSKVRTIYLLEGYRPNAEKVVHPLNCCTVATQPFTE